MPENVELILNPARTPLYRLAAGLLSGLGRVVLRPQVTGASNIPATGPVLVAPVHRSNLDFMLTLFLSPRKVFFMAKAELFGVPVLGTVLRHLGAFPVNRAAADRESLRLAEEVLRRGHALVMFPEGTRRDGPRIGEILDGAMFVASRTGARVVPVGIAGSDQALPASARMVRPARIHLVVGPPIDPPSAEGRVPRSAITAATEQLRQGLQSALDAALRAHG
ncbi:MAG: lysophospholipid acyltransferase family protein [Acidimicrobiales bacterium]